MEKFSAVYRHKTGLRVDKFLSEQLPGLSRADIQRAISAGQLSVGGRTVTASSWQLRDKDEISFRYEIPDLLRAAAGDLLIRYENADLAVVEKPAGLPVYETSRKGGLGVLNLLLARYPGLKAVGEKNRPGIVHRLDKGTSGLLVVAKTDAAYVYLKKLFVERKISKEYLALVSGRMAEHGKIAEPLTKIGQGGRSRVRVDERGKTALTEYWLVGRYRRGVDEFSLLRVKLHTGRTHQIRVHFANLRHPVLGDSLYGKPFSRKLRDILPRMFLHAARLQFRNRDGERIDVSSPLPEDLQKTLAALTPI